MKKCCLILAFLIGMISCSEGDIMVDESQQTPNGSHLKSGADGKYDLLGFGYDVTGRYLDNELSRRFQVIDVEAFVADPKNKGKYDEDNSTGTTPYIYSGATSEDFLSEIKTKNKIGTDATIPIGAASLGLNLSGTADINNKYTYSTKYSFARVDVVRRVKMLALNAKKEDLIPYLNPAFVEALNRDSPGKIILDYGTHVLCDISIGARLEFEYRSAITEESNRSEKKLIVEAGANFNVALIKFGGDQHHEVEINRERNKKNSTWNLKLKSYGNSHSGIGELNFSNEIPPQKVPFNLSEWEKTVNATNAVLTNINWTRTYPIYEFVKDPIKKAQIKAAMESYIASKVIQMQELRPMYRMWNPYTRDTYYFSDWSNVQRDVANGAQYYGLEGYMLAKSEANTKPMYRMWNPYTKDTYYFSDWNNVQKDVANGASYHGTEGYILSKSIENTKPFYRMWNPYTQDTYYFTDWNNVQRDVSNGAQYHGTEGYIFE